MENNFNLSSLSDAELNEFYVNAAKEISARREQKSQEAWNKMVSAIKEYLEVDDSFIINYAGEEFYIDDDADFSDVGAIIVA
jgi:hypothetical protein